VDHQEAYQLSQAEAQALEAKYAEKGIEVTAYGKVGKPQKITEIRLQFTPEEWVDLMYIEGEFLPACCANISAVRDILIASVRERGLVRIDEFVRMVELLEGHHCIEPSDNDPISRIRKLWETIKEDVSEERFTADPLDPTKVEDACKIIYNGCHVIRYARFFDSDEIQADAHKIDAFLKMYPAIQTLKAVVEKHQLAPVIGFGLVVDNKVFYGASGPLIYSDEKKAEAVADAFGKRDMHCSVRPIRVTLEKGFEIL
jgi:hypothetical protein